MSDWKRQHERHAAVLAVRFVSATDFVTEYAENLSVGGLFVRQAHKLVPLSPVTVHIELAGYDTFVVEAKVAHILDEAMAEKMGREAGAGLQLVNVPPGFGDALAGYLARLGRRRDFLVLAEEQACADLIGKAGFRSEKVNPASVVEQTVTAATLLAIVVKKSSASSFRQMLGASPKPVPVIGCHFQVDEEPLLCELDRLAVEG